MSPLLALSGHAARNRLFVTDGGLLSYSPDRIKAPPADGLLDVLTSSARRLAMSTDC
jgi:hypothetical protein